MFATRRLAALTLCLTLTTPALAKPNIVVIMTDDQEDTGSMGYMPTVHSLLAEHGVTFRNSFANLSLCSPSRISFLTGQAAHNHHITSNDADENGGWQAFKDKEPNTLPVWLKQAGYQTALLGKYLNLYGGTTPPRRLKEKAISAAKHEFSLSYLKAAVVSYLGWSAPAKPPIVAEPTWVPPGWDLWYAFTGPVKYYNYRINQNGEVLSFGRQPGDYSTDVLAARAVGYIKDQAASQSPFFLLITPKTPHSGSTEGKAVPTPSSKYADAFADVKLPVNPAFNQQDVSDKPKMVRGARLLDAAMQERLQHGYRAELQSLQSVDDLVEAVVGALKETGKLDNTVIIYTSDNGYAYGDHRLIGKSAPYEPAIKIPLVIRGPSIPENETRSQLVDNLDLVATIETIAGVKPGLTPDGRNLWTVLADRKAPWRSALLIEGGADGRPAGRRFLGVRTETTKYVKWGDGFEELYDLVLDPYELKNQAADGAHAEQLSALRHIHDAVKNCAGESCWVP